MACGRAVARRPSCFLARPRVRMSDITRDTRSGVAGPERPKAAAPTTTNRMVRDICGTRLASDRFAQFPVAPLSGWISLMADCR